MSFSVHYQGSLWFSNFMKIFITHLLQSNFPGCHNYRNTSLQCRLILRWKQHFPKYQDMTSNSGFYYFQLAVIPLSSGSFFSLKTRCFSFTPCIYIHVTTISPLPCCSLWARRDMFVEQSDQIITTCFFLLKRNTGLNQTAYQLLLRQRFWTKKLRPRVDVPLSHSMCACAGNS